ncbi:MAG TPA: hypothetical protein PLK80_04685 [bacterium]|nr:MAG: hypothetical protein BWY28_00692 [bacterium ADurb.Bin236]HOY63362.1 hypothetical protein [bacterium]HPI76008.1 hypothetical protein [bacterium]HPN95929.1 hypothetical protein [bacterium]
MKKLTKTIMSAVAAAALTASAACAQQMPDSIFNNIPQAFGNNLQDVPPDILDVSLSPGTAPGSAVISAKIWVDPEISKFKVKSARVFAIRAGGELKPADIPMSPDPSRSLWWTVVADSIPAGEAEFFIRASDEVGNEVIQLPKLDDFRPALLTPITSDGEDLDIPASLDILGAEAGHNGSSLMVCGETRAVFQSFTNIGAAALIVGYIPDDVRFRPSRSSIDNTSGFMAHLPALNLSGLYTLDKLANEGAAAGEAEVKIAGRRICMSAAIDKLTPKPERGLKIFCGTGGIAPSNRDLTLADSTPYAILYFGGAVFGGR